MWTFPLGKISRKYDPLTAPVTGSQDPAVILNVPISGTLRVAAALSAAEDQMDATITTTKATRLRRLIDEITNAFRLILFRPPSGHAARGRRLGGRD